MLGGSVPEQAAASSPIDIGLAAPAAAVAPAARAKLMPSASATLAPPLLIEHEVGHHQPDLARGGRVRETSRRAA